MHLHQGEADFQWAPLTCILRRLVTERNVVSGQNVAVILHPDDVGDLDLAFSRRQPTVEAVKIAQCAAHLCVHPIRCARALW